MIESLRQTVTTPYRTEEVLRELPAHLHIRQTLSLNDEIVSLQAVRSRTSRSLEVEGGTTCLLGPDTGALAVTSSASHRLAGRSETPLARMRAISDFRFGCQGINTVVIYLSSATAYGAT